MPLSPKHLLASLAITLALAAFPVFTTAQNTPEPVDTGDAHAKETLIKLDPPEVVAARLAWWADARFGMFIHWGLYSQWGCHYPGPDGKLLNGRTEHMMRHLQIPRLEYAKIAALFNPVKFNADEWVRVARDAGMKYMIITSKHHDGFAMFNSPSDDYNIVKRTPWACDPIKELSEACQRAGLKFGVYYSLGRDWNDPDVPTDPMRDGSTRTNYWDFPDQSIKVFSRYFERKVKPQIRELLTQYPVDMLWFDTPEKISPAESIELIKLIHSLRPNCIINQRVGNRYGDYRVEEQSIPVERLTDPWETCMTLNRHWGYYLGDENWKTPDVVIRNLIDIASKNGNFLLNVGPTGEGVIPAPSVSILEAVGRWLATNGAAIRGTTGSPIGKPDWGRCTEKLPPAGSNGKTTLYLHVFDWPANKRLVVPGIDTARVESAKLLAGGQALKFSASPNAGKSTTIEVPATAPDAVSTTIVVTLAAAK